MARPLRDRRSPDRKGAFTEKSTRLATNVSHEGVRRLADLSNSEGPEPEVDSNLRLANPDALHPQQVVASSNRQIGQLATPGPVPLGGASQVPVHSKPEQVLHPGTSHRLAGDTVHRGTRSH